MSQVLALFSHRRRAALAMVLALVAGTVVSVSVAGGQGPGLTDLRGGYSGAACVGGTLAACEANPQYPNTLTIDAEDFTTGVIGGSGVYVGKRFSGRVSGCTVTLHTDDGNGYTSDATLAITADGNTLEGTFSDSFGRVNQPTFERRTSGGPSTCPPSPTTQKTSATAVACDAQNPDSPNRTFVCTATVADASGAQSPTTPTGSVKFAIDAGRGGAFPNGDTCTLQPSQSGPTAYCTVTYLPGSEAVPPGTQPPLTGTYLGSATLSTSSGRPMNIYGGPPPDPMPAPPDPMPAPPGPTPPTAPKPLAGSISDCAPASIVEPGRSSREFRPAVRAQMPHPPPGAPPAAPPAAAPPKQCRILSKKDIEKATAQAMANSLQVDGDSQAVGSALVVAVGGTSLIAPVTTFIGTWTGIGAGISIAAEHYYERRVQDPPDPHWRRIALPRAIRTPLPRLPPRLGGRLGRLLVKVVRLEARVGALDTASATTINRASTAAAAHNGKWERRQMEVLAAYSSAAARILTTLASTRTMVAAQLRGPLGSSAISAGLVRSLQAKVSNRGLPRHLASALRRAGATPSDLARLRAALVAVDPVKVVGSTSALVTKLMAATAVLERKSAANQTAYAVRIRQHPVASNAS